MVDMKLSNDKLLDRGVKMIRSELNISETEAYKLLMEYKNVRAAINSKSK